MKFEEYLRENLVPEWKDRYLDYKAGKKKIKQVASSPPNFLARTFTNATLNRDRGQSDASFTELPPAAIAPDTSTSGATETSLPDQRSFDDRTPLLQSAQRAARGSSNQFEQYLQQSEHGPSFPVSRRDVTRGTNNSRSQSYGAGASAGTIATPNENAVPMVTSKDSGMREFIGWLDMELNKIQQFYKEHEDHAVERFLLLQDQLFHLSDEKNKLKAKTDQEELIKKSLAKTTSTFNKYELPSLPNFNFGHTKPTEDTGRDYEHHRHEIPYYVARRQLKAAVQEFYRGLELLKNYRMLNRTAFRKLVKKFDKKTNSSLSEKYMEKVNSSYFASSDILDNLIPKVEDLFSANFENGNRKIAVEKLRSSLKDDVFYTSTFISGLLYGTSVPLLIYAIYFGVKNFLDSTSMEGKFVLQIWAGFLLMILLSILFGINCYIWSKYKVNYKFIFEFNQRTCLNSKQFHVMPALFLFALSLLAWFGFNDFWPNNLPSRDWPWFFFGFSLCVFFCPFDILFLDSRRWMIFTIWRLIFSGFYPVEFKDFFIGDIFCSLTYTMGNISFFFCIYATHWKDADIGDPVCGSSRSKLMGFMATLPSIWRFLQCLRRYSDSGDWFPHLANMAKYSVSIGYYVMLSIYRIHRNETNRGLFILVATMNSVYSSMWDVFMDWSLMQDNNLLRKDLVFPRWSYYSAMSANLLLRFQWIFYALFSQQIQQSALTSFFVAIAEIVRRFIWLIYRMENEHIANIRSYRASRESTLPYETLIRSGVMSRSASVRTSYDQEAMVGIDHNEEEEEEHPSVRRRGTVLGSMVFQNVSKAIGSAHAKDFQRRKINPEHEAAGSDDDNSDDEVSVLGNGAE